mgnify:CR=1 FL=1
MRCWHCNTRLIWGGDHDVDDDEDYSIVSNLSCPKCHSIVYVYYPSEKLRKEYEEYENNLSERKIIRLFDKKRN